MTMLAPGSNPGTDVELISSMLRRLRNLENPSTQRVGAWVLSEAEGLVASSPSGLVRLDTIPADLAKISASLQNYVPAAALPTAMAAVIGADNGAQTSILQPILDQIARAFGALQPVFNLIEMGNTITAWIQSAVSDPGAFITTEIAQITDIFAAIVVTPISDGVQQVKDWWTAVGGSLPDVAAGITAAITGAGVPIPTTLADAGAVLGNIVQTAGTNAQGVIDGIVQAGANDLSLINQSFADAAGVISQMLSAGPEQLLGALGNGITGFIASLGAHKASTVQTQAQVVQVAAALNTLPTSGGTDYTRDFTLLANAATLTGVMSPGTGAMGITSGQAILQSSTGSTTDTEVFTTLPTSPYVVIEVTLGSLNDLLSAGTVNVATDIVFRCNSARTALSVLRIKRGLSPGVALIAAGHTLASSYVPSIATDGVIKIIIGDRLAGNPYVFEALYDNVVVIPPTTDSSHYSDVTQFYVGLSQLSTTTGKYPPGIKKIRYYDNAPTSGPRPFSGRPASNSAQPGALYSPSDVGRLDRDNGTSWDNLSIGPLAVATPPPASGWSWVNQGGATDTVDRDALLLVAPNVASGETTHMRVRTLSPASGYVAEHYLEVLAQAAATWTVALILRNSISGLYVALEIGVDTSGNGDSTSVMVRVSKWNSTSSFNSNYVVRALRFFNGGLPLRWRWRDDGATRYAEYGYNGTDWMTLHSVGRTDFVTPDQIGRAVFNQGSGQPVSLRCRSLAGVS